MARRRGPRAATLGVVAAATSALLVVATGGASTPPAANAAAHHRAPASIVTIVVPHPDDDLAGAGALARLDAAAARAGQAPPYRLYVHLARGTGTAQGCELGPTGFPRGYDPGEWLPPAFTRGDPTWRRHSARCARGRMQSTNAALAAMRGADPGSPDLRGPLRRVLLPAPLGEVVLTNGVGGTAMYLDMGDNTSDVAAAIAAIAALPRHRQALGLPPLPFRDMVGAAYATPGPAGPACVSYPQTGHLTARAAVLTGRFPGFRGWRYLAACRTERGAVRLDMPGRVFTAAFGSPTAAFHRHYDWLHRSSWPADGSAVTSRELFSRRQAYLISRL